ncbi:hypothetical protein EDC04DRAFT_3138585 [Pisolithus marmoratus]|nr:hypothetical protein EDC04DRAFT_3138585 [Pisolithus marmoratus]
MTLKCVTSIYYVYNFLNTCKKLCPSGTFKPNSPGHLYWIQVVSYIQCPKVVTLIQSAYLSTKVPISVFTYALTLLLTFYADLLSGRMSLHYSGLLN